MIGRPLIADTGGLLRALACRPDGRPSWPVFEETLRNASRVIVPALILADVDYFLRDHRSAMQQLVRELFDPKTTYEYEPTGLPDVARAMELDLKFASLSLGLVDGVVAAVAERRRVHRILTIDREDFGPLRLGERFNIALELLP